MAQIRSIQEELVQLAALVSDETIDKTRLSNGDRLVRSVIGETLILTNGVQIMIRPGYFSLSSASGVSIEKRKDGTNVLTLSNGDEVAFSDQGIQSLTRAQHSYRFLREPKADKVASRPRLAS